MVKTERNGHTKCKRNLRKRGKKGQQETVDTRRDDCQEGRRKCKSVNTEEGQKKYNMLSNQLRRQTDKARQKWWEAQCQELAELDKKGLMDQPYRKVKALTKNKIRKIQQTSIQDKNGNKLTNPTEVCTRWKEYKEELYDNETKQRRNTGGQDESGKRSRSGRRKSGPRNPLRRVLKGSFRIIKCKGR